MYQEVLKNNKQLEFAMRLRLSKLQREDLPTLTLKNLEDALMKLKWKNEYPSSLSEAIDDIYSIGVSQIVAYLAHEAIVEGKRKSFKDYQDLFE